MEFELPKINVNFEYDKEKDEMVFFINGVEKRVKTEDMITDMEKLQEQDTALEQQPCDDCISRTEAQKRISIRLYESALNTVDYDCKTSDVFKDIAEKLSTCISELPSIQPKEIYNKGWKDGAEATAYHVELCEEENPTIPLSVIEEIKSDIAEFMSEIPTLGNCKEGWHNAGQRIGLEQACEIIDKHIAERGSK